MAKIKTGKTKEETKTIKNDAGQGKADRVLSLISLGFQDVQSLAETFNTVNLTIERRKATDADNTLKIENAKAEAQKEMNRHDEEMARIENEWKKISIAAEDKDRRLTFIKGKIDKFDAEYDKYMGMKNEEFLSSTVTSRLESLRKVIMELTKELNRA